MGDDDHNRLIADRYRLLQRLGQGGMGAVYRALDTRLHREVALKILQHPPDDDAEDAAENQADPFYYLLREARTAAGLDHPGLVRILDSSPPGSEPPYIVMELIAGGSLHELLARGGVLPEAVILDVLTQLAQALTHAHARGVMHRDIKPGNVMLMASGRAVLTDFGLAKPYRHARAFGTTITGRATAIMGTPSFIAPEQVQDGEAGPESDVFSLGCVAYAMATGDSPFAADDVGTGIDRLVRGTYTPLGEARPELSAALQDTIAGCLRLDLLDRPDAADIARRLEEARGSSPPGEALARFLAEEPAGPWGELDDIAPPPGPVSPLAPAAPPGAPHATPEATPPRAADATASTLELAAGTLLDGYEIVGVRGRGAMGVVYEASHPILGRRAAVKVLSTDVQRDAAGIERFIQEGRVVVEIAHPGIADIFAFGRLPDGRPYLIMEWLAGDTLRARLQRGPLTVCEAATLAGELAEALAAAHRRGVVHRDVKPANIMLVDDPAHPERFRGKLLDFGIAKTVGPADPGLTMPDSIIGTPGYMSPEQAQNQPLDARSDLYALGVVLFESIFGTRMFPGASPFEVIARQLRAEPPSPRALWPGLPAALDVLIGRMTARDPAERPGIDEVRQTLQRVAAEVDPALRFDPERAHGPGQRARWSRPLIFAAFLGGGSAVGLGIALLLPSPAPSQPPVVSSPSPLAGATPTPEPPSPASPLAAATPTSEPAPREGAADHPERPVPAGGREAPVAPDEPLTPAVAAELQQAEDALARADYREALRLASRSLLAADTAQARRIVALARCGARDLSNARAAMFRVAPRDRAAVRARCRELGIDL